MEQQHERNFRVCLRQIKLPVRIFFSLRSKNAHGRKNLFSLLAMRIRDCLLYFLPTHGGGLEIFRMNIAEIFLKLSKYFSYPFVQYAFAAGILIALCSSLLGVTLVLKRYSFIGDGLSHVAFGAMAIAGVLNMAADMTVVLPITAAAAILLLKTDRNTKIKGDAAIATVSVGALAIGYLIINQFSSSANVTGDVCSSLFGSTSILTLRPADVLFCAVLSAVVLGMFVLLYNKIFAITFDEEFAKATGINTEFYNLFIAVITAIIIVLAMRIAGSLLTSALIIFPALSAMRLFKSFKSVIICSGVLSVFCSAAGIIVSLLISAPVGAMIVVVNIVVFLICMAAGAY